MRSRSAASAVRTNAALALAALAAVTSFRTARADDAKPNAHVSVSATDAAEAEQLFDAAKELMNAHDYAGACAKFAASQEKDPAAGTLLNLANCYSKNGQTASAWVTFKDAATSARQAHRKDWETLATKRASELTPQLSRLTIRLAVPMKNVTITRDGHPLSLEQVGSPIVVDPGMHHIEATAPGRLPAQYDALVGELADTKEVVIAELATPATPPPPPPVIAYDAPPSRPAPVKESSSSPLRPLGLGMAIVGGVGIGVGVVTGLLAIGKNNDANAICPNDGACRSHSAVSDGNSAHSLGVVSTVGFVAGGVLAAGGLTMVFLAPRHSERTPASASLSLAPLLGRDRAGLGLSGRF